MIVLMLIALAASTDSKDQPEPTPLTSPASWFPAESYPASAIRTGEDGAVRFALDVSATGAVTACRIVESSGFADLDGQTCASAMQSARFSAAHDKQGKAVASTFVQRTRWVLPSDDQNDSFPGMFGSNMNMANAEAEVSVDTTGRVTGCKIKRTTGVAIDPCQQFPVGKIIAVPTVVDGKPVATTLRAFTWLNTQPVPPTERVTPHNP